jgi:hypothetical protein
MRPLHDVNKTKDKEPVVYVCAFVLIYQLENGWNLE